MEEQNLEIIKPSKLTIREFLKNYQNGEYKTLNVETQAKAGWFGWACNLNDLSERTNNIYQILIEITDAFMLDNYHVWFKNYYSPLSGFYDDVKFEPLGKYSDDQLYFGFSVDDKSEDYKYVIWTARNDYKPKKYSNNAKDVVSYINNWGKTLTKIYES